MKVIFLAGYVTITFFMLVMTIQTYRQHQGGSYDVSGEVQHGQFHWGR
ncbi:hypothetical protein [Pseudotabrizicola alkalilacus]|nr:hypothetical protein [Pseudotabrizicola alkalilacus]